MVFDMLTKRLDDQEARWDKMIKEAEESGRIASSLPMTSGRGDSPTSRCLRALCGCAGVCHRILRRLDACMEGNIDDIHLEVGKLSKHWEHTMRVHSPPLIYTA
jgi:hypothetical protein